MRSSLLSVSNSGRVAALVLSAVALGGCGLFLGLGDFEDAKGAAGPGSGGSGNTGATGSAGAGGQSAITIDPGDSKMGILRSQAFTANVPVTWSVEEAAGGSIDDKGLYLSPEKEGTFHVVATGVDDTSQKKSVEITVVPLGMTLVGGIIGGRGNIDGTAKKAHFSDIRGLGYLNGTIIVSDTGNHTIRKFENNAVTTLAGVAGELGTDDGKGPAARFNYPADIAIDPNGSKVWIADEQNFCIRRIDTKTGDVTTLAGTCGTGGYQNAATGGQVLLGSIDSMVLGPRHEALYTCEIEYPGCPQPNQNPPEQGACFRGIRRIDTTTGKTTTIVTGLNNGCRMTTDAYNNNTIYFNDNNNEKAIIKVADVQGGAPSSVDKFTLPVLMQPMPEGYASGMACLSGFGGEHDVYTLGGSERIMYHYIIGNAAFEPGIFSGAAGDEHVVDGTVADARYAGFGAFIGDPPTGHLYLGDTTGAVVRDIDLNSDQVKTVMGATRNLVRVDGMATEARLTGPFGIALDEGGNIYASDIVFDSGDLNETIRKIDASTHAISTFSGVPNNPGVDPPADGPKGVARFGVPTDLVRVGQDLFVVDAFANAIRKVALSDGAVTTPAGELGVPGNSEGVGAAAHFSFSGADFIGGGIATDGKDLYVTDPGNFAVRKVVVATGTVSTFAGGTEGTANGVGKAAQFLGPAGITYSDGFLYVADALDSVIRRIDAASGEVTSFVGLSGVLTQVDGDASKATFAGPSRLIADGIGNLYVSEAPGSTIRRIHIGTKVVSTLAGIHGQLGLSPAALPATVNCPMGFAVDAKGDLLFADFCDGAVAAIRPL